MKKDAKSEFVIRTDNHLAILGLFWQKEPYPRSFFCGVGLVFWSFGRRSQNFTNLSRVLLDDPPSCARAQHDKRLFAHDNAEASEMSETYYVYFLKSLKDGKFYTGQTTDPKKRLARHNRGEVRSTKARRPFKLVYWEALETRSAAMKRERKLKSLKHAGKLKLVRAFRRAKTG